MSLRTHLTVRSMVPLAVIVGGLFLLMRPAPASASPNITISLTNAPSYCVNREGGSNARGATVFLYACSGGNNHWYEADAYYGTSAASVRAPTYSSSGFTNAGTYCETPFWGQDLVTANDANRNELAGDPDPIDWHQWTGP